MRSTSKLSFLLLTLALNCFGSAARASHSDGATGIRGSHITNPPAPAEMVVLTGKITNPKGPLPGAVVMLKSLKLLAVTNADGEFELTVPANAGIMEAVVTYAGYEDQSLTLNTLGEESTTSLTNEHVITVSRKFQMKRYLKTAQKQVRKDLRQVRK